jgi:hypothetical protein
VFCHQQVAAAATIGLGIVQTVFGIAPPCPSFVIPGNLPWCQQHVEATSDELHHIDGDAANNNEYNAVTLDAK